LRVVPQHKMGAQCIQYTSMQEIYLYTASTKGLKEQRIY